MALDMPILKLRLPLVVPTNKASVPYNKPNNNALTVTSATLNKLMSISTNIIPTVILTHTTNPRNMIAIVIDMNLSTKIRDLLIGCVKSNSRVPLSSSPATAPLPREIANHKNKVGIRKTNN